MKYRVNVSPEMVTFIGSGVVDSCFAPGQAIMLLFSEIEAGGQVVLLKAESDDIQVDDVPLILVVTREACTRLFPDAPLVDGRWHLGVDLRGLIQMIRADGESSFRDTMRLAQSIELLCGVMGALEQRALVPADATGDLSATNTVRIIAARRLIDERWQERLTLDSIARHSGINRAQLIRGFKSVYACTVGDALAQNRLDAARNLLRRTDMSVASIGYRCGYRNNSSFTRAFTRHFGIAPSQIRKTAC